MRLPRIVTRWPLTETPEPLIEPLNAIVLASPAPIPPTTWSLPDDGHAGRVVAEVDRACRVGTEIIALNDIARSPEQDAGRGSTDHVPVPRARSADGVAAASDGLDAFVVDAELDGAGDVGADAVALDVVALSRGENHALADAGDGVANDVEVGTGEVETQ